MKRWNLLVPALIGSVMVAPELSGQAVAPSPRLPAEPAEITAVWDDKWVIRDLIGVGCPTDSGYAEVAHKALVEAAETNRSLRHTMATEYGLELANGTPGCPKDLSWYETVLVKWLRQDWENDLLREPGSWDDPTNHTAGAAILSPFLQLGHGKDPATYDLLKSIALDPDVDRLRDGLTPGQMAICPPSLNMRYNAAGAMVLWRFNEGMDAEEAMKAVEAELGGIPQPGGLTIKFKLS